MRWHRNFKVVMKMNQLVRLSPEMEQQYLSYMEEWRASGETIVPMACDNGARSFAEYLASLPTYETEEGCPEGFVPGTMWFYVDETGRILGALNFRHRLNEFLRYGGGHIGYGVRPSERRKGYAAQMLAAALEQVRREYGLDRVLITCDSENTASAHTILKNGGVLENEVPEDGRTTQRYWITL